MAQEQERNRSKKGLEDGEQELEKNGLHWIPMGPYCTDLDARLRGHDGKVRGMMVKACIEISITEKLRNEHDR